MYERNLPVRVGRESPRDLRLVRWALESKLCLRVRPEGSKGAGFPYPAIGQSLAEGSPDTHPLPGTSESVSKVAPEVKGNFWKQCLRCRGQEAKAHPKGWGWCPRKASRDVRGPGRSVVCYPHPLSR